jgi:hypothetical protein
MSFGANFRISDNSLSPNPYNTKIKNISQGNINLYLLLVYTMMLSIAQIIQSISQPALPTSGDTRGNGK